jgi:hypothetical protein
MAVCAELALSGTWVPDLPQRSWQDRWARDPEGVYLAWFAWGVPEDEL